LYLHPDLFNDNTAQNSKCAVVLIRLHRIPPNFTFSFRWHRDFPVSPSLVVGSNVCGASTSGPVLGTTLVYDPTEEIYIFIEDAGEAGHSGTLIWTTDTPPQLLGVYIGILPGEPGMRPRARVAPLIFRNLVKFTPRRDVDVPVTIPMGVPHRKNAIKHVDVPLTLIGRGIAVYKEGNPVQNYFGVVLEHPNTVKLCGSAIGGRTNRLL